MSPSARHSVRRVSPVRDAVPSVTVVVLVCVAACTRGLPARTAAEQAELAAAGVAAEPSAGCGVGVLPGVAGTRRTIRIGEEERAYLIDAPAGPRDRPLPVVLAFHGFRSGARALRWWTGWGGLARREGFILLTPEGHDNVHLLGRTGRGWDMRPVQKRDLTFVRGLLDRIEGERCVDRRRVFATGMSNGGFFANLVGCALADRVAAIAPVAGGLPLHGCRPARPVPVLLVYGRADRIVRARLVHGARDWWVRTDSCGHPAEQDGCARYADCAADVVYCEGPQAHRWPGDATERIWRFFEVHPRC
jgi:polyhydroxybutyrate depolymerase